jgi:starch-binding outer membrane protein, SusD/RagB family
MKRILSSIKDKSSLLTSSIKYFAIAALSVPVMYSCTKLDEKPYTTLDPNSFYKNGDELGMAASAVYNRFRAAVNVNYFMALETVTELGAPTNTKGDMPKANAWIDVNNAAVNYGPGFWANAYRVINAANIVLARGEDVTMDQGKKERMYAEVRFLRAYTNYILVRLYGGVPIPKSYTSGLDGLEIPRNTVQENYDQIIEDLKFAIEKLPAKKDYPGSEKWKASKGAAQALLGEVYLTRGSMENNVDFFKLSKQYLGEVIASGEYDLESDYKNLWFWYNQSNKNSIESLFELQFGSDQGNGVTLYFGCYNGRLKSLGSTHFLRTGPSISAYLSYEQKDKRLAGFLTEFADNTGKLLKFNPNDNGAFPGTDGWASSGPGNVKWYDRTDAAYQNDRSLVNTYMIRYADVLLNYAEVENRLSGPTSDALDKLNKVRRRAGLDPLDGLSQQGLDDAILRERGWEFIGEGQLYYDELRTDRLGKNVYEHVKAGVQKKVYQYLPLQFVPQKTFLWMIPQGDLNSNPALQQNPANVTDPRYPL